MKIRLSRTRSAGGKRHASGTSRADSHRRSSASIRRQRKIRGIRSREGHAGNMQSGVAAVCNGYRNRRACRICRRVWEVDGSRGRKRYPRRQRQQAIHRQLIRECRLVNLAAGDGWGRKLGIITYIIAGCVLLAVPELLREVGSIERPENASYCLLVCVRRERARAPDNTGPCLIAIC